MSLQFLLELPAFELFALVVGVISVATIGVHQFVLKSSRDDDRSKGAIEAFKTVGTFIAFLLAFSLVEAQENFRSAERLLDKEAIALNDTDRELAGSREQPLVVL